jgi:hypothetical protein
MSRIIVTFVRLSLGYILILKTGAICASEKLGSLHLYGITTHKAMLFKKDTMFAIMTIALDTYLLTPWPLVRERTIPTERPPLFDEI